MPPAWQAPKQCQRFFAGRDNERGSLVLVERTAADQIRPVAREGHAARLRQALEATSLFSRSSSASGIRAIGLSSQKTCQAPRKLFLTCQIATSEVDRII